MLVNVFSYKGTDYKGNRIPDTYQSLVQAATKIREIHRRSTNAEPEEQKAPQGFTFSYILPGFISPMKITNDEDLQKAINLAFQALDDSKMMIKFLIEDKERSSKRASFYKSLSVEQ